MKKIQLFVILLFSLSVFAQQQTAFGVGEWFKFRIHYGFVNAGYATLEVKEATNNGQSSDSGSIFWFVDNIPAINLYKKFNDKEN